MIAQWSATHQATNYAWQHFMVNFLRRMDAHARKRWSHEGLLPVRCETDYITALPRGKDAFDPRNVSYAVVIRREVPNLAANMSWNSGASDILCGDCIEALMGAAAVAAPQRGPQLEGLADKETWEGANSFFTEYSYAVWRIHRVKTWLEDTVKTFGEDVRELLEQVDVCFSAHDCVSTQRTIPINDHVHPPVSVASSSGDHTLVALHDGAEPEVSVRPLCERCEVPSTMVCSSCQVAGCGLCIILYRNPQCLLCRDCRAVYDGSSPAAVRFSSCNSDSSSSGFSY